MPEWDPVSKASQNVENWREFIAERIQDYTDNSNWHLPDDKKIGTVDFDSMTDKDLMKHLEMLVMQYIKIFEEDK